MLGRLRWRGDVDISFVVNQQLRIYSKSDEPSNAHLDNYEIVLRDVGVGRKIISATDLTIIYSFLTDYAHTVWSQQWRLFTSVFSAVIGVLFVWCLYELNASDIDSELLSSARAYYALHNTDRCPNIRETKYILRWRNLKPVSWGPKAWISFKLQKCQLQMIPSMTVAGTGNVIGK